MVIQCISDVVATLGQAQVTSISPEDHLIKLYQ